MKKKTLSACRLAFSPLHSSCQLALVAPPPNQPQTLTSKPVRRLVYRLFRDSRYFVKRLPIDNTAAG